MTAVQERAQVATAKDNLRCYTIEVLYGSGYRQCYLNTSSSGSAMKFDPQFSDGNLSRKQHVADK